MASMLTLGSGLEFVNNLTNILGPQSNERVMECAAVSTLEDVHVGVKRAYNAIVEPSKRGEYSRPKRARQDKLVEQLSLDLLSEASHSSDTPWSDDEEDNSDNSECGSVDEVGEYLWDGAETESDDSSMGDLLQESDSADEEPPAQKKRYSAAGQLFRSMRDMTVDEAIQLSNKRPTRAAARQALKTVRSLTSDRKPTQRRIVKKREQRTKRGEQTTQRQKKRRRRTRAASTVQRESKTLVDESLSKLREVVFGSDDSASNRFFENSEGVERSTPESSSVDTIDATQAADAETCPTDVEDSVQEVDSDRDVPIMKRANAMLEEPEHVVQEPAETPDEAEREGFTSAETPDELPALRAYDSQDLGASTQDASAQQRDETTTLPPLFGEQHAVIASSRYQIPTQDDVTAFLQSVRDGAAHQSNITEQTSDMHQALTRSQCEHEAQNSSYEIAQQWRALNEVFREGVGHHIGQIAALVPSFIRPNVAAARWTELILQYYNHGNVTRDNAMLEGEAMRQYQRTVFTTRVHTNSASVTTFNRRLKQDFRKLIRFQSAITKDDKSLLRLYFSDEQMDHVAIKAKQAMKHPEREKNTFYMHLHDQLYSLLEMTQRGLVYAFIAQFRELNRVCTVPMVIVYNSSASVSTPYMLVKRIGYIVYTSDAVKAKQLWFSRIGATEHEPLLKVPIENVYSITCGLSVHIAS